MGRVNVDPWLPLGAALLDFHRGDDSASLLVRSDMWEDEVTPAAAYYRPDEVPLPELERRALAACRGRVLDIGAGAGRHSLELQRLGLEVHAIDCCEQAITIMRERGVLRAEHTDVRHLGPTRPTYDTLLLLMNGLGLVGTLDGLFRFLEIAAELLSEDGQIVCDSADLAIAVADDAELMVVHDADRRYPGEVEFRLRYGEQEGERYPWLFVDPTTLALHSAAAGFDAEVLCRGERGAYLACLRRQSGRT